jgi:hypothetical protein
VESACKALIAYDGTEETLVEEVLIEPHATRFAWIRMFPSRPEIRSADINTFPALEVESTLRPPYRDGVIDSVFGPSIFTLLTRFVTRGPAAVPSLGDELGPRHIAIADRGIELFEGRTWSSTVTRKRFFPRDFEAFVQHFDLAPSERERQEVMRAFDDGWTIAALMVDNSSQVDRLVVGPTLYRFKTTRAIHPGELTSTAPKEGLSYFLVGDRAIAPIEIHTAPDERPWDREAERPGDRFVYSYNHEMDPRLALEVDQLLGDVRVKSTHLVRGKYRRSTPLGHPLTFGASDSLSTLPLASGRGSAVDVILCLLLGITPLLYTPESWLLFMLGLRSRDNRRRNAPDAITAGSLLWPLYSLVVAVFWVVHLDGSGRMAALIPLFVGIFQLASPPPERERRPIRIDFSRRRRGKRKAEEPKPSKPPEAAGSS